MVIRIINDNSMIVYHVHNHDDDDHLGNSSSSRLAQWVGRCTSVLSRAKSTHSRLVASARKELIKKISARKELLSELVKII